MRRRASARAGQVSIFEREHHGPGPKTLGQICSALQLSNRGYFIKALVKAILMFSSYRKTHVNTIGQVQPRLADGNWQTTFTANVQTFLNICGSAFFPQVLPEVWRHDFYWGEHPKWSSASGREVILEGVRLLFEFLRSNDPGLDLSDVLALEDMIQPGCDICGGGHVGDNEVYECLRCEVNYHPACCAAPMPIPPVEKVLCTNCIAADAAKVALKRERAAADVAKMLLKAERATVSATNIPEKRFNSNPRSKSSAKKFKIGLDKDEIKDEGDLDENDLELSEDFRNSQARLEITGAVNEHWEDVISSTKPKRRKSSAAQSFTPLSSAGPRTSSVVISIEEAATTQSTSPALRFRTAYEEAGAGYNVKLTPNDHNVHTRNLSSSATTNGPTTKKRSLDRDSASDEPDSKRRAGAVYTGFNPVNRPSRDTQTSSQCIEASRPDLDSRLGESSRNHYGTPATSGSRTPADTKQVKDVTVTAEGKAHLLRLLQPPHVASDLTTTTQTGISTATRSLAVGSLTFRNATTGLAVQHGRVSDLKDTGLTEAQINGTTLLLSRTADTNAFLRVELNTITSYESLFEVCGLRYSGQLGGQTTTRLLIEVAAELGGWFELRKGFQRDFDGFIKRIKSKWNDKTKSGFLRMLALTDGEV